MLNNISTSKKIHTVIPPKVQELDGLRNRAADLLVRKGVHVFGLELIDECAAPRSTVTCVAVFDASCHVIVSMVPKRVRACAWGSRAYLIVFQRIGEPFGLLDPVLARIRYTLCWWRTLWMTSSYTGKPVRSRYSRSASKARGEREDRSDREQTAKCRGRAQ